MPHWGSGFGERAPIEKVVPVHFGTEMPNSDQPPIELQQIRQLASVKLQQYSKNAGTIRECYLFDGDFFKGIRYEMGAICFLWKSSESSALILRGDLLLETVSLTANQESRRAA